MDEEHKATLWVAATPLGNDGDFSPRAGEIAARADAVLAEDTRRTGLLFKRLGVGVRKWISLHEHNEEGRLPQVLGLLEAGAELVLVSDAGTPLLSDPGYRLVRACRQAGFRVAPLPGPSAPTAALSVSGLPPYPSTFLGFLPRKAADAKRLLERHAATGATLVFFERASRLQKTLALAAEVLGNRECVLAREMTKTFEEFLPGRLEELAGLDREFLGEVTVVVAPGDEGTAANREEVLRLAAEERARGGKPREVARRVAAACPGWSPGAVYELLADRRR